MVSDESIYAITISRGRRPMIMDFRLSLMPKAVVCRQLELIFVGSPSTALLRADNDIIFAGKYV